MLNAVGKEIRVDEDGIWGDEGGVILEEEGGRDLGTMQELIIVIHNCG